MNQQIGRHTSLDEFIDDFPLRIPTLLLVENDPLTIDVDYWVDLYRRTHADGILLSAGGYMAFYPTRIPYHYKSRWLDRFGDLFGTLVSEFRKIGMKYIFARTDPHAVHADVLAAHPEWVAEDIHGAKKRHWAYPDAYISCALGDYNFAFMNEVNKEILSLYDVDFIFSNRWAGQGTGICYCENCRRLFFDAARLSLPPAENLDDPVYLQYLDWREERMFQLAEFWSEEMQKVKPGARFIPNSGGGATSGFDMVRLANMVPCLNVDRQARPLDGPVWSNGKNGKEFRSTLGRKPAFAGVNVGLCGPHRWMDSTKSPAELTLWLAEAVANGMVPQFTKHSATVYNERWVPVVEQFFPWLYKIERYLRNIEPVADVAIVYSQQTGRYYGKSRSNERVEHPINGFYQALIEARIPFEMVHDHLLDEEHLKNFRTLILPNIAALSDAQCEQIRAFVRRGGNIVATLETSRYDERGRMRADFGLADLFGVSALGETEGPLKNTYLHIEQQPDGSFHPLVKGLEDAGRIVYGLRRVPVTPHLPFHNPPLTLVPQYPDLPMEELYPRQEHTDISEVFLREIDSSRIVYFPWDVDRVFWEVMDPDHMKLLVNAVTWANQAEGPVQVEGQGVLDVTVWRQKRSMTVHIVNLTNPMMMRGAFREFYPVHNLRVRIRLPEGERAQICRLLWNDCPASVEQIEDGWLTVTVPVVEANEIIAVDFV